MALALTFFKIVEFWKTLPLETPPKEIYFLFGNINFNDFMEKFIPFYALNCNECLPFFLLFKPRKITAKNAI